MEGSPSYEQIQIASNVATPLVVNVGSTVVLQNELMEDVGEGIVRSIRTGELLSGLRLHPNNLAVQVTAVFLSRTPVREPLKDTLEECVGCTIRWPRARLKGRSRAPTVDATHVASVFEFSEHEGEDGCTPLVQPTVIGSSQPIGSSGHDSNQTPTPTMAIPFVDGLSTNAQRRTYTYRDKEERRPYIRRRGEARDLKMTLESLREDLAQCQCQRRCLENIHDLDILGLRYKAWDSKSYSKRGTWIRGMLEAAKVRYVVEGREQVKFQFKIGGLAVCNKCYGVAIGYSERHFKRLKGAVRAGCVAAVHGNSQRIPEGTHTSTACAILEQYIASAGCPQPHRDIKRLCDGAFCTLVLLPMNTRRIDVFDMVNEKIRMLGPQSKYLEQLFIDCGLRNLHM